MIARVKLGARTAAEGAYANVLINLASLEDDEEWSAETRGRAERALETVRRTATELARQVEEKL